MLIDCPTAENILQTINECQAENHSDFFILCGEEVKLDFLDLIDMLNQHQVSFCGGIFPKIIQGNQCFKDKVLLLPVHFDSEPLIIKGLDSGNIDLSNLNIPSSSGSLFILVDGLSNYISEFVYSLYKEIGSDYQVFGSGAGHGSFERKNCVFNKDGFFKDAAVIVLIKNPIIQSIRHGWKTISGPYLATKTTANILEQINWEPAYKVYKKIVEQEEGIVLTEDNYYEYAKHYPFGVHRADGENLIRDPVALAENEAIRFGAEIPSNAVLYLMKSKIDQMLQAGNEVCHDAINRSKQPEFMFFADCISRRWILKEKFEEELNTISSAAAARNIPVFGVLSLGEISSANGALLDYHHKTIVISIVEKNG